MAGLFFRLLLKALFPVLMVLGGLSYVSYLQGHDPLAMLLKPFGGLSGVSLEGMQQQVERMGEKAEESVSGPRTVYRWRDANGQLYYGEQPPADALSVKALRIDPNTNVIAAFRDPKAVEAEAETQKEGATAEGATETDEPEMPNPYSPDQIKQLFEDTKLLKEKLESRQLDLLGKDQQ